MIHIVVVIRLIMLKKSAYVLYLIALWYKELNQYWEDPSRPVPLFLVGTKKDLISDPATLARLNDNQETVVTMEEVRVLLVPNRRQRRWHRS